MQYALALAPETDFFIHKAIGWALRDRTRPEAVRAFITLGTENLDDKLPVQCSYTPSQCPAKAQPLVP